MVLVPINYIHAIAAAKATTAHPHLLQSPAFIGGIATASVLGALLIVAALQAWRKRTQQARARKLSFLLTGTSRTESYADPSLSERRHISCLLPRLSVHSADSLSTAVNPPASRFARPFSDTPTTASLSAAGSHVARMRLFQKILTMSRPRGAGTMCNDSSNFSH